MKNQFLNLLGAGIIYVVALGLAWLTVRYWGFTWERALLAQILWVAVLCRWHQTDKEWNVK